ncbi:alpha/beta fold hydrolase [Chitinimonas viridis]|uniref:alpha/beta fold hydrolase n=1 Tax=Chitinimonas viridis TaxID=664880 RepID=UPI0025B49714|nr:alpha/beta hydrolase [Chitinimonas viridis]
MVERLVLLSGMDGTGTLFAPLLAALGGELTTQVIRYPDQPLDYGELAAWVVPQLPTDTPYLLLGESFSGPIAIQIAARQPSGLMGLILCATFAHSPIPLPPAISTLVPALIHNRRLQILACRYVLGRYATASCLDAVLAATQQISSATLRSRIAAVLRVDARPALRACKLPMLYLQAVDDRLVRAGSYSAIKRQAPHCQLATLAAPHFVLQTLPSESARLISTFARSMASQQAD